MLPSNASRKREAETLQDCPQTHTRWWGRHTSYCCSMCGALVWCGKAYPATNSPSQPNTTHPHHTTQRPHASHHTCHRPAHWAPSARKGSELSVLTHVQQKTHIHWAPGEEPTEPLLWGPAAAKSSMRNGAAVGTSRRRHATTQPNASLYSLTKATCCSSGWACADRRCCWALQPSQALREHLTDHRLST
jgi:hypothetical protein